ncbi:MAG: hypothetical protein ACJ0QQ_02740 [Parvicellaceae bacterium]|nr:hypothetical protein [Flavobacteriales bacterium]
MDLLKTYNRIFIISSIIICFSSLNSCYKPDQTIAIIRVLDNNTNNPIENISVRLFFDDSNGGSIPEIDIIKNTLSNGTASFDFSDGYRDGQAGFAVLDIEVDGVFVGVINIVEMTTTEKVIYIQ